MTDADKVDLSFPEKSRLFINLGSSYNSLKAILLNELFNSDIPFTEYLGPFNSYDMFKKHLELVDCMGKYKHVLTPETMSELLKGEQLRADSFSLEKRKTIHNDEIEKYTGLVDRVVSILNDLMD